jgi:hypothetical protein
MNFPDLADDVFAPDDSLERRILHRIGNRIREFRVVEHPEGLVLKGWAVTYHAKQLAQHAAMDLTNRLILANDIEVR